MAGVLGVAQQLPSRSGNLWATRETPEVLCVHREHLILDELDVSRISSARDMVQHLVVVADIAEIEQPHVSLPGRSSVTLVCGILRVKAAGGSAVLEFPHLAPQGASVPPSWNALHMEALPQGGQIHVYAQQLVGRLQVHQPLLASVHFMRHWDQLWANLVWTISPYASAFQASPASLSVQNYHRIVVVDPAQWRSYFAVVIPHSPPLEAFGGLEFLLGIEADLVIIETIFGFQTHARETAMIHAERLNQSLLVLRDSGITPKEHILGQLYRTQALLKLSTNSRSHLDRTVTRVQYDEYGTLIKETAREAESYDAEIKKLSGIMNQPQATRAPQLVAMYRQLSQKETTLGRFRSGIRKAEDVMHVRTRLQQWKSPLEKLQAEMEQAKHDMDEGVAEYNDPTTANALFAVLKAVASIGLAMFTGGGSVGESVGEAIVAVNLAGGSAGGQLQTVIGMLQVLVGVMEVLIAFDRFQLWQESSIDQILNARSMPALPGEGEWESSENVVGVVASTMPKEGSDVPIWNAKCKSMVVLCREITMVATYMVLLQSSMRAHDIRQNIAQMYVGRLSQISPLTNLRDYSQLVTLLDVQRNRILLDLLDILELQNEALLFEYLFPATPISGGWPQMEDVCRMLAHHEAEAVVYMSTQLGEPTNFPIVYGIRNIPVGLLENHDTWMFTIPIHGSTNVFPPTWSRLRIQSVQMRFTGLHQPATDDGQVHLTLEAARAFQDRRGNDVLHFNAAVPPRYRFSYNPLHYTAGDLLDTAPGQLIHAAADAHVMHTTPFTEWRLFLSEENKALAFPTASSPNDTTEISITLFLTRIMTDWAN